MMKVFSIVQSRPAGWPVLLLVLLLGVACGRTAKPSLEEEDTSFGGPPPPAAPLVTLLKTPREIREDLAYPPAPATQQAFFWTMENAEWRFKLPLRGFSYAGFRFTRAHNVDEQRNNYELIFTIDPITSARHLWVALIDGDRPAPNVMVDLPLAPYLPEGRWRQPREVRIPLRDFEDHGSLAGNVTAATDELEAPFNWMDVREIRFFNPGGRIPDREVTIKGLRLER